MKIESITIKNFQSYFSEETLEFSDGLNILSGETGAGKTTTALSIMQLIPDPPGMIVDGEIYFEGKNVILNTDKENQAMRGNGVAMIFQDPMTALNPVMTVGEQLSEVVLTHEKVSKAEILQAIKNAANDEEREGLERRLGEVILKSHSLTAGRRKFETVKYK